MNELQKLEAARERRALIRTYPELEAALYRVLDALVDTVLNPPTHKDGLCVITDIAAWSLDAARVFGHPGAWAALDSYQTHVAATWARFGEALNAAGYPTNGYFIPHPQYRIGLDAYNACSAAEFWGYEYEYGRNRWDYLVHVINTICEDLEHAGT